jgi:hypothetical protein
MYVGYDISYESMMCRHMHIQLHRYAQPRLTFAHMHANIRVFRNYSTHSRISVRKIKTSAAQTFVLFCL